MKVTVLGAAREVGRSAFLVNANHTNILMDYGVLLKREPIFPMHVKPKDVDAVVISHAHLDHSGFVPSLFLSQSTEVQVLGTFPTFELSQLLIEDMIKISGFYLPFEYLDLVTMLNHSRRLEYRDMYKMNDVRVTLHESGHILGGATVIVEHDKKRLFYTGDINTRGSKLLRPADLNFEDIDLMIIESTYSQTEQTPREQSETDLLEFAYEVIERNGTLFIPAFSVERAQEIACVLKTYNFPHKIVMDGMALKANEIMMKHPTFLRDPEIFKKAITEAEWVSGWSRRKRIVKEPCVIISPAGMLVGGTAVFYLQEIAKDSRNGIAIVSYQGEGTPGKMLLEKRVTIFDGRERKCLADVKRFEFSGHNSRSELFEILDRVKGNPKVLTVHGDGPSCTKFAEEISEKYGYEAKAPNAGELIEF
ncbi:MAG: MBL fold metallo-hydrolase [Thermoproteota archaeon]|jgi:putative mRNA 3-end processing factor|nr:MBL fold metallo-hydrolase [Thermoproteota archaeon]HEU4445866.1 MBL fold metallo-hydrolase [Nitrososphaeraceae archaeon]